MRLVSPAFNTVASRYLFETIILYEHPDRWKALNHIAGIFYLAPLVQCVQLPQLGYLPDCNRDDPEEGGPKHDCRLSIACGSYEHWDYYRDFRFCCTHRSNPPAGGPFAKMDFSSEEIYKRYLRWIEGERVMKQHVEEGTAPSLNLHQLTNLKHVETIGLREMRVIKRKYADFAETRRYFETGLIETNALHGSRYVPLCHLPTFMIACSASGKELTSLTIHRLDELFKGLEYNNDNPSLHLKHLRCLKIDLAGVWYNHQNMDDHTRLAPWVYKLEKLETVQILQNPEAGYNQADVPRLLRSVTFPKLKSFELKHGIASYQVLKYFLQGHNETLRSIYIQHPIMEKERWAKLKARYALGTPQACGKEVRLLGKPHTVYGSVDEDDEEKVDEEEQGTRDEQESDHEKEDDQDEEA